MEIVENTTPSTPPPSAWNPGGSPAGFVAGNPGRPKGIADARAVAGRKAAQALAAKAWAVVEEMLAPGISRVVDGKELWLPNDARLRVDAAKIVLAYAHGQPRQALDIDVRGEAERAALKSGIPSAEIVARATQLAAEDAN